MMTWRKAIENQFEIHKDSWKNVVSIAPEDGAWLDYLFDDDETVPQGEAFTVWTKTRIYFPVFSDNQEYCDSISRDPDQKPTRHIG